MTITQTLKAARDKAAYLKAEGKGTFDRDTAALLDELVAVVTRVRGQSPTLNWVSTRKAAIECGVTPTTIIRWVDNGKLIAFRTAGGHRRIRRADLNKFKTARGLPK